MLQFGVIWRWAALLLTAASVCASRAEAYPNKPLPKSLSLQSARADATLAVRNGDSRLIAIHSYALYIPCLQHLSIAKLENEYGIVEFSDTSDDRDIASQQNIAAYACAYNKTIVFHRRHTSASPKRRGGPVS